MCCVSHSRQLLFAESRMRSIISSSVLKSDVSERNSSRFSVLEIRKSTVLSSVYWRYENQQFSVQCTGDTKTNSSRFSVLEIRKPLQLILDSRTRTAITAHCTHFEYISCSARAHHQFCFIQTQFVNVSSLTIITAQVFHKSSLIPIKH